MKKMTVDQHRELGAALKALRNDHLVKAIAPIMGATRRGSRQCKAIAKAISAIDELRNVMDELAYREHFAEIGDEFMRLYYGDK